MQHSDVIVVKKVIGKGRGVFAKKAINKGDVIETVPVLLVPICEMVDGLNNKYLSRFFYYWTKDKVAISLGYGTLYNHSFEPNAIYEHGHASLTYLALRPIAKGEEICINYNWDPKDKTPVSFKVV